MFYFIVPSLSYVYYFLLAIQCLSFAEPSPSHKNLFYVYDWPHLVDRYANYSDRPHHGHGVEFPQWRMNYGAGRLISADDSEYKTSQFALFKMMYERTLLDPRRTKNPDEAVSFFIPYDFGMDATFIEQNGRMRRTQCPLAEQVISLLKNSPYFKRNGGHDHTLVVAVNQNMNYFFNAQPCINMLLNCWNCTKVAIDEYMFIAKDRKLELKKRGINWHAVPFPADYHYNIRNNEQKAPWERSDEQENRTVLVSFMGNARKFSEVNTLIREALIAQCNNHTSYCSHGAYHHDAKKQGPNGESRRAVFCLQPPGDMPTRKSVFDAALSGCIPVLFHPLTARYMYEWHPIGGQAGWDNIAVSFDTQAENKGLLNHSFDVVARLQSLFLHNRSLVRQKRQHLRDLAHQLQYSLVAWNNDTQRAEVFGKKDVRGQLVPDAYDVTMGHILAIHSGTRPHNRTSAYLSCAQLPGNTAQTSDYCTSLNTIADPFSPPSLVSPLFVKQKK
jgi:xyloglucan galactosyltransferase MUR3